MAMRGMRAPRREIWLEVARSRHACGDSSAHGAKPAGEAGDVVFGETTAAVAAQHDAEELRGCGGGNYEGLARVKKKAPADQKRRDALLHIPQDLNVVVEQGKIVDVPHIALRAQDFLHEMVERIEIDVGERLARQVPDGQPAPPLDRGKQVVAGEENFDRLLRVGTIDDRIDDCEQALVR